MQGSQGSSFSSSPCRCVMLGMVHVCCLCFVLVNCCNDITVLTAQWARGNVPQSCMHLMPKGRLAQTVRWPSGTPQVLGSTPRGSGFQAEVKKIPSPVPMCQSAVEGSGPVLTGLRHLLRQDGGGGSGVFSICVRRSFFLTENPGAVITPRRSSFFNVKLLCSLWEFWIIFCGACNVRCYFVAWHTWSTCFAWGLLIFL